jgi:uncharacterized membrane protein YadS
MMNTQDVPEGMLPVVRASLSGLTLMTLVALTGCTAIEDIFKAGAWIIFVGIAALAAIVFGVVHIFRGR